MAVIQATFEKGVFRPTNPVDLPESCVVEFEPRIIQPTAVPQVEDFAGEAMRDGQPTPEFLQWLKRLREQVPTETRQQLGDQLTPQDLERMERALDEMAQNPQGVSLDEFLPELERLIPKP